MAFLYNNQRVKDFRDQRNKVTRTHEELKELKLRIDRWNQVLHRKETDTSEAESGLLIDMDDCMLKLKRLKKKQTAIYEHPEKALRYATLVERLFIWFHKRINNLIFMHDKDLDEIAEDVKKGANILPNPVIDYYIKVYIESKERKIKAEEAKLEQLKTKKTKELIAIKEQEEDHFTKEYSILGLIVQILLMLGKYAFSSSQEICFLLMILAQITNGNLLSLVYVIGLFCYGLTRRRRPHSRYWKVMKVYTGLVIVTKYCCIFVESVLAYKGIAHVLRKYQTEVL